MALVVAFLALSAGGALGGTVGVREITVATRGRSDPLTVAAWYPTSATQPTVQIGENAVFRGVPAAGDGPIAEGRFPIILLAHGGFRAAPNSASWLASALAERGYVVIVMRPPAIAGGRATQSVPDELSLRPADMRAALTAVSSDARLAGRIDWGRVGAVGFFLGGHAVLELAGARVDPAAYARSCDGVVPGLDCAWLAAGGVDLHRVDAGLLERSNRDPRVASVIALDPELSETFTSTSLEGIAVPIEIISLGRTAKAASAASRLAGRIPKASHANLADASPFSTFAECKPKGSAILKEDGGEDLCDDAGPATRAEIHRQLAAMIDDRFRTSLGPTR